jgi:hypothetical protein
MGTASSRTLACLLFFIAVMGASAAEPAPRPNPVADYHFAWLQVTSAIGEISRTTLVLDADKPDAKAVKALTDATDRLEAATSTLIRIVPPAENTRLHVTALPRVIEIVGAARETLHVLEGKDNAEIATSLEWLDNSLLQLQKAVRTANLPVEKSGPGGR